MSEFVMPQPGASRQDIVANWQPENQEFWEKFGKKIAKENLIVSTAALTLSFCVWYIWSTVASQLNAAGFKFTTEELFTLAAIPGLVGATLRFLYTYMPALCGGKNWTFISTLILLIPIIGLGFAVQDTSTSYTTFLILTVLIGVAGGNFSSSMAYIGNFYPKAEKGTALGINGGIGNLGVAIILLLAPMAMASSTLGNIFGVEPYMIKGAELFLANGSFVLVIPTVIILLLILKYMVNLPLDKPNPKAIATIMGSKHTWAITLIYTCGFGAFSGYAAALSLLVSKEFPDIPFTYMAFLGPLVSATLRPVGGWLGDKINSGTKVTYYALIGLIISTALIAVGIDLHNFVFFFIATVITFVMTGIMTGATFRMIPHIFTNALQGSLVTGFVAAVAAYGAFVTPKLFGFIYSTFGNIHPAFAMLLGFNILTLVVLYWFYARKNSGIKC